MERTKRYSEAALYQSFRYVDSTLDEFYERVKNIPNTWIVITGDHTPGGWVDGYRSSVLEKGGLSHEFVPCFIISPLSDHYTDTSTVLSFLDISPTILELAGVSAEIKSNGVGVGRDYGKTLPPIEIQKGVIIDRYKIRKDIDAFVRKGK